MKTLRLNDEGQSVVILQKLLKRIGHSPSENGKIDTPTDEAIKSFQQEENLGVDGIAGSNTWKRLFEKSFTYSLGAKDKFLEGGFKEYFPEVFSKKTIYLHHTAGAGKPPGVIRWWEIDAEELGKSQWRIGTAFVVGRTLRDGTEDFDGKTWRAFREYYWCNHLGIKVRHSGKSSTHNKMLEKESIGIEICSYGPLEKLEGKFFSVRRDRNGKIVSKTSIPDDQVVSFEKPWRGFQHFHKYTDKQIAETKRLILLLSYLFDIPLADQTYDLEWFDINQDAYEGKPGLWTHCNVRPDKTDCFPQAELIEMMNSLHEEAKNFVPHEDDLDEMATRGLSDPFPNPIISDEELQHYSTDLDDIGEEE